MFESLGVVDYPTFLVASLLIVLCPGPNSLYVLRTSVSDGARVGFAGACGVWLGDIILLLAVYLGVAALIIANPSVFFALKCAGAAYLLSGRFASLRALREAYREYRRLSAGASGAGAASSAGKVADVAGMYPFSIIVKALLHGKGIFEYLRNYENNH